MPSLFAPPSSLPDALARAQQQAAARQLPYSGGISPVEAWALFKSGRALLVDVRSAEERHFVGHVPNSLHVPWAVGTSLSPNPDFVDSLETQAKPHGGKRAHILLLCRSGKRSAQAAAAAIQAGFRHVFNVLEGFEGELNTDARRGGHNGWRYHRLPWVQD